MSKKWMIFSGIFLCVAFVAANAFSACEWPEMWEPAVQLEYRADKPSGYQWKAKLGNCVNGDPVFGLSRYYSGAPSELVLEQDFGLALYNTGQVPGKNRWIFVDEEAYVRSITAAANVGSYVLLLFKDECTGVDPLNAVMCPGDDIDLTQDTPKSLVDTCGAPKCEFTCNAGYVYDSVSGTCQPGPVIVCPVTPNNPSPESAGESVLVLTQGSWQGVYNVGDWYVQVRVYTDANGTKFAKAKFGEVRSGPTDYVYFFHVVRDILVYPWWVPGIAPFDLSQEFPDYVFLGEFYPGDETDIWAAQAVLSNQLPEGCQ